MRKPNQILQTDEFPHRRSGPSQTCRALPSAIWSVVPGPRPSKEIHMISLGASTTTTTGLELAERYLVPNSHPMVILLLPHIKIRRIPRGTDEREPFPMVHPDNRAVLDVRCWSFRYERHSLRPAFLTACPAPGSYSHRDCWHSTACRGHRVNATRHTRGSRLGRRHICHLRLALAS